MYDIEGYSVYFKNVFRDRYVSEGMFGFFKIWKYILMGNKR